MNKRIIFSFIITLLMFGNTYGKITHTIYVSGPPVNSNINWFKESKLLYNGIKKETYKNGNSIELFPKKEYRTSILKSKSYKVSRNFKSLNISKRKLLLKYKSKELLAELISLILKRRDEILGLNSNIQCLGMWDTKIHLKAHGSGGKLLTLLKDSKYTKFLGTLIVFDGESLPKESIDELIIDSSSELQQNKNNPLIRSERYLDFNDIYENEIDINKEILSVYLNKAKNLNVSEESIMNLVNKYSDNKNIENKTVINITINEILKMSDLNHTEPKSNCLGCNTKEFFGTAGAIVAIIGAILALL